MIKVELFRTRLTALTALFGILMTLVWALPQTATATPKAAADTASTASTVPTHPLCARPDKPDEMACFAVARDDVQQTGKGLQPLLAPAGLGPADLQSAYDLPSDAAGAGATVAVVDAYDNPNAEADLAVYRSQFGLPPCTTANGCLRKTDQRGGTDYPQPDAGWAGEIGLDLDMISAACPLCRILLVEADGPSIDDLGEAENTSVALGATYVSNSWGASESAIGDLPGDAYYKHPGVAITFSSGDNGYGTTYPASLPYVTAVGGTSLSRDNGTTRGWTESAWTGAGSGCSAYHPKPSFQTDRGCADRAVADVSAAGNDSVSCPHADTESVGRGAAGCVCGRLPVATRSSAHTVLPGAAGRGVTPQSSARAATRSRPRPDSDAVSGVGGVGGGCFSARVSVASMRKVPSARVSWRWKSRPGTWP